MKALEHWRVSQCHDSLVGIARVIMHATIEGVCVNPRVLNLECLVERLLSKLHLHLGGLHIPDHDASLNSH